MLKGPAGKRFRGEPIEKPQPSRNLRLMHIQAWRPCVSAAASTWIHWFCWPQS